MVVRCIVQMLEAQSADGKYDIALQLKAEVRIGMQCGGELNCVCIQVSQLAGQNSELREQLQKCADESREALKEIERKKIEVCMFSSELV